MFVCVGMAELGIPVTPSLPGFGQLLARMSAPAVDRAVVDRPATFEQVYRDHFRDVYRYVLFMSHQRDDADDVVAEVFRRAFEAWRDGRGPAGRPLPWLLLVARRLLTDRWRRGRLIRWVALTAADAVPVRSGVGGAAPADATEFWMWLHALAEALPDRQREALLLRYQRDLTDAEIGEVLGLSESGVRSLVSRAVAALRRHPELWS